MPHGASSGPHEMRPLQRQGEGPNTTTLDPLLDWIHSLIGSPIRSGTGVGGQTEEVGDDRRKKTDPSSVAAPSHGASSGPPDKPSPLEGEGRVRGRGRASTFTLVHPHLNPLPSRERKLHRGFFPFFCSGAIPGQSPGHASWRFFRAASDAAPTKTRRRTKYKDTGSSRSQG